MINKDEHIPRKTYCFLLCLFSFLDFAFIGYVPELKVIDLFG